MSSRPVQNIRASLFRWYRRYGRDLPWRQTRDPYAILVSEIMLQQTQVTTVVPYFDKWLRRFPNFEALAKASESDVLHAWQGLGYYARTRNLHKAARAISKDCRCPRTVAELQALPGIGRYTANAVACFAFDQPVPVVDANIGRVVARLFNITTPIDSAAGRNQIWEHAERLVPKREAAKFNSALMDLGATICVSRAPRCPVCPVRKFCRAKNPAALPIKKARPKTRHLSERHGFNLRAGRLLLQKSAGRWCKMWILPPWRGLPMRARPIYSSVFPFTNHRVTLEIFPARRRAARPNERWIEISEVNSVPIPSPHRRAIDALLFDQGRGSGGSPNRQNASPARTD